MTFVPIAALFNFNLTLGYCQLEAIYQLALPILYYQKEGAYTEDFTRDKTIYYIAEGLQIKNEKAKVPKIADRSDDF